MKDFKDLVNENLLNEATPNQKRIREVTKVLNKLKEKGFDTDSKDVRAKLIEKINELGIDEQSIDEFLEDDEFKKVLVKKEENAESTTDVKPEAEEKATEETPQENPTETETTSDELTDEEKRVLVNSITDKNKNDFPEMDGIIRKQNLKNKIKKFVIDNRKKFEDFLKKVKPTNDLDILLYSTLFLVAQYEKPAAKEIINQIESQSLREAKLLEIISFEDPASVSIFNREKDRHSKAKMVLKTVAKIPEANIEDEKAPDDAIKGVEVTPPDETSDEKKEEKPSTSSPSASSGSGDAFTDIVRAGSLIELEDAIQNAVKEVNDKISNLVTKVNEAKEAANQASVTNDQKAKIEKVSRNIQAFINDVGKEMDEYNEKGLSFKLEGNKAIFNVNKDLMRIDDNDLKNRTSLGAKTVREISSFFSRMNRMLRRAEIASEGIKDIKTLSSRIVGGAKAIAGSGIWKALQRSLPGRALNALGSIAKNSIDRQAFYGNIQKMKNLRDANWGDNDQFKNTLYNIGINSFKIQDKETRNAVQNKVFAIFDAMKKTSQATAGERVKEYFKDDPAKASKAQKLVNMNLTIE